MSEIRPSDSLLATLSKFADTRNAQSAPASSHEKLQADIKARLAASDAAKAAKSTESSRVQVSSTEDVDQARQNVQKADDSNRFHREAPNAGVQTRFQPPGQIVDIKV